MSEALNVRGLVLEYGVIPPAQGPARHQFLLQQGLASLVAARRDYDAVTGRIHELGGVEPSEDTSPVWPIPFRSDPCWPSRRRALKRVWRSVSMYIGPDEREGLGATAARAEKSAVSAWNHLEDLPLSNAAHNWVHRTGALRRALLGCGYTVDAGLVWTSCATRIAHVRRGLSIGAAATRLCSSCLANVAVCPHLPGEIAPHIVSISDGVCSVCGQRGCGHDDGDMVMAPVAVRLGDAQLDHVALVRRPRFPNARITSLTLETHGIPLEQWKAAACDACLGPCLSPGTDDDGGDEPDAFSEGLAEDSRAAGP